jgi:Dolichyl-phosphate-mannose-protein mannosyltransferase
LYTSVVNTSAVSHQAQVNTIVGSSDIAATGRVDRLQLLLLACVFLLAGALRVYNFDARSLWNDEGYTILYARLPWPDVLGLNGQYDQHPPLYYALVKLADLFIPEQIAGRLISVVAGSLTVLLLFELARRLLNTRAALVASFVLAISPVHIWYSQEARQYALTMSVIALSYLAIIAFKQSPAIRWAVVYGVSVALAVYFDYSALFALVPQVILLVMIGKEQGRNSLPLFGALALAIACYLPWVPQAAQTIQQASPAREVFLGLNVQRFLGSIGTMTGMEGQSQDLQGKAMTIATVVVVLLVPFVAWKYSKLTLLVVGLLSVGTIAIAVLATLLSPSFAARTIITAVLAWAIMLSLVVTATDTHILGWKRIYTVPINWLGWSILALAIVVSTISIIAANEPANIRNRPPWPEVAASISKLAKEDPGFRIVVPSKVDYVLIDIYAPNVLEGRTVTALSDLSSLPRETRDVWLAYHSTSAFEPFFDELKALHYVPVQHVDYAPDLYLDQYHLP